jgi:hypothetical protein
VERSRGYGARAKVAKARAHLARGTLGEGKRENALGGIRAGGDSISNAMRNRSGLSRASARENAHRAAESRRHLTLFFVEGAQNDVWI